MRRNDDELSIVSSGGSSSSSGGSGVGGGGGGDDDNDDGKEFDKRRRMHSFSLRRLLHDHRKLLAALLLVWALLMLTCEAIVFNVAMLRCEERITAWKRGVIGVPSVVALIADPQLTDERSYSGAYSTSLLPLVEFVSDTYMRKSFVRLLHYVQPDAVVIAGDMMDNTRYVSDATDARTARRFEAVFGQPSGKARIPVYNISGNHDIGWGEANAARQVKP